MLALVFRQQPNRFRFTDIQSEDIWGGISGVRLLSTKQPASECHQDEQEKSEKSGSLNSVHANN
jgi:hypothetical protein